MPKQEYLSIPTAFERVTGRRPSPPTCWRWSIHGSKGVVLETWMVGGRRATTEKSVENFIEATTKAASPEHWQTQHADTMAKAKADLAKMLERKPRGRPRKSSRKGVAK